MFVPALCKNVATTTLSQSSEEHLSVFFVTSAFILILALGNNFSSQIEWKYFLFASFMLI